MSTPQSAPNVPSERSPRLLALDAFRGLTILAMILVNNPGSWSDLYWPVGHADWHGWTPTDLIFPFFLFIVGTAMAYSLRKYVTDQQIDRRGYLRIARRVVVLLLLGLLLNSSGQWLGLLLGKSDRFDFATLRFPGVLQRIALVYGLASLIVLHVRVRAQIAISVALLLGYWALLAWMPVGANYEANLSEKGNIVGVVDRAVLGERHIWSDAHKAGQPDPEGMLSTLPAIVTTLLGYWTGISIQRRGATLTTVAWLVGVGLLIAAVGQVWGEVFPINKKIWTSSYVLLSGGLAIAALGLCLWLFDVAGWRRAARPLEIVGVNAIFVFVASGIVGRLISMVQMGDQSLKSRLYETLFAGPIDSPKLASLAFAAATVALWWAIPWLMSLRGWTIRV